MGRRATERLFPSRFSDRYYHLTTLRRQIEEVAAEWLSATRKSVVVDVGCGTMPYRPIFEPYAAKYLGVDLPSNPRADVHIGQDGRITLPNAVADLVLSTQVLEHVESPAN